MSKLADTIRNNARLLTALASLVVIGGAVIGGVAFIFSPPDLQITREQTPLAFPSNLVRAFDAAATEPNLEMLPDSLDRALADINSFLRRTETFTAADLRNNTNHALTNLRIRMTGLNRLNGWGIRGDGLTPDEIEEVFESIVHSDATGILTAAMSDLPAQSTLTFYLWGDIPCYTFTDIQPITASYDGGGGEIVSTATISGLDVFVYRHSGLLLVTLVVLNVAVLAVVESEKASAEDHD